jgi:hypothetical protein
VGDANPDAAAGSGDDRDFAIEDSHRIHLFALLLTVTAS